MLVKNLGGRGNRFHSGAMRFSIANPLDGFSQRGSIDFQQIGHVRDGDADGWVGPSLGVHVHHSIVPGSAPGFGETDEMMRFRSRMESS